MAITDVNSLKILTRALLQTKNNNRQHETKTFSLLIITRSEIKQDPPSKYHYKIAVNVHIQLGTF